jgi:bifunctional isochorismate lyase/aryl carrier protein
MRKTAYFTKKSIERKSVVMRDAFRGLNPIHSNFNFNIRKSALLVLDMQKYFLIRDSHAFIPSLPAIIPNIQNLINTFYISNSPIYFTQHFNEFPTAGMMAVWWKELLSLNSENSSIISELDTSKGETIKKERYDAFWNTSLEERLQKDGIEQVVICGVMTHLCCESTARSAFIRDYQVYFTVDGTATYSERLHKASLLTLSHGFAIPVLCNEIYRK